MKNIKFNSKTNCPICRKKKPFKYVGECLKCCEDMNTNGDINQNE